MQFEVAKAYEESQKWHHESRLNPVQAYLRVTQLNRILHITLY